MSFDFEPLKSHARQRFELLSNEYNRSFTDIDSGVQPYCDVNLEVELHYNGNFYVVGQIILREPDLLFVCQSGDSDLHLFLPPSEGGVAFRWSPKEADGPTRKFGFGGFSESHPQH